MQPNKPTITIPKNPLCLLASVVGLLFCLLTAPLFAQKKSDPELFNQYPFDEWVRQGPIEQIPWNTEAFDAGLSLHQRLIAHIDVAIKGKELARRNKGDLVAMVQITDSSGHAYRDARKVELGELKSGKHDTDLVIEWDAFVLPGDYTVVLAIQHTGASERSLGQRTLHVRPLKDDPLPDSGRNLPTVEFLLQLEPPDPDVFYHPEIKGKLFLPVTSRHPLQVEVMGDITPSPLFHGSTIYYGRYLSALVSTLKVLSQVEWQNAGSTPSTMDVSTLNLVRHRAGFEQDKVGELEWARLKKTVAAADTVTVDVSTLGKKPPSAAFLHDEILRRMQQNNTNNGGVMQVFVVISSPLSVYSFDKLKNEDLPQQCNCRIFYLEYDASRHHSIESATGKVEKMLRPVKVRSFREHSPEGLREAIAKMMTEAASY